MTKNLTLGTMTMHPEYKIPIIEVLIDGEISGYMSPFRGYFFQVSGTYDGHSNLGRSINEGLSLKNYLNGNQYTDRDILKALAITALVNFSNFAARKSEYKIAIDVKINSCNNLDRFIERTQWFLNN